MYSLNCIKYLDACIINTVLIRRTIHFSFELLYNYYHFVYFISTLYDM